MRRFIASTLAAALIVMAPAKADAAAIVGGDTRVLVESAFVDLVGGLTGTATLFSADPLIANFPVTGGTLDASLAGQIRHDGSGLILTNGTNIVDVGNFVIDTVQSLVFGDVSLNGSAVGSGIGLFSFDLATVTVPQLTDLSNPILGLFITADTAGLLTSAFGVADLTGVQFGRAATAPVLAAGAIPEPATWAMMILGFGVVGFAMRRGRAAGRVATVRA